MACVIGCTRDDWCRCLSYKSSPQLGRLPTRMFFVLAGTGLSRTFPSLQRLIICVGNCAGVTIPSEHAKKCHVRQYLLHSTIFNAHCNLLRVPLWKGVFCDLEVRRPPSTNEVYTTLRSLAHVPCSAAAMPRRHFQCCSNVVWIPTYSQSTRLHVSNCFMFGACTSRKPKNEVGRKMFVVVARGFHFQRCVFSFCTRKSQGGTRTFVQRGSFDLAISGGRKGVTANIGNFMQFHPVGLAVLMEFDGWGWRTKRFPHFHSAFGILWFGSFNSLGISPWASCFTGSRSTILICQRFLYFDYVLKSSAFYSRMLLVIGMANTCRCIPDNFQGFGFRQPPQLFSQQLEIIELKADHLDLFAFCHHIKLSLQHA